MLRLFIFFIFFGHILCDEKNWWKTTEIYQIYIPSFKDSNGDGVGDLNGITQKLDHFKDLQIGAIWISPFFESPRTDMGYDVSNYTNVDSMFGTLKDFDELMREADIRGIKVFIDGIINHSSDEHPWFQKSVKKIKPYDEYYVWKDAKGHDQRNKPIPPNNWLSLFGGSAWEWVEERAQFYLHLFNRKQPDLNLRNENVKQELKDIFKFWFDKGVSGVRMDAAPYLVEHSQFKDEPLSDPKIKKSEYKRWDFDNIYSENQKESYEVLREFRLFFDDVNKNKGGWERVIIVEAYCNLSLTLAYYGTEDRPIAHYPFNFVFAFAEQYFTSTSLNRKIMEWLENMPKNAVPTWNAENHDRYRIGSRFVPEYIDLINILMMTLPGVATLYYGQEIGMVNGPVRPDQGVDTVYPPGFPTTRDPIRTPMQWDSSINAGFTSHTKPWLPVNPNYWHLNADAQKSDKNSHYSLMKELSRLRKAKTFKHGGFNSYLLSSWVYAFTRTLTGFDSYVILFNLGTEIQMINFHEEIPNLPAFLKILVASGNSGYRMGDLVKVKSKFPRLFVMKSFSALVLSSYTCKDQCISDDLRR